MNAGIWDFWAPRYDSLWVQRWSLGPTRTRVLTHIPRNEGCRILDMGCGTGQLYGDLLGHFGELEFSYTGVDSSPGMLAEAARKYPEATLVAASMSEYRSRSGAFDVIVCSHAFPYFEDQAAALHEFRRMLDRRGHLVLTQASADNLYDSMVLFFVKLTTSHARYPSRDDMGTLAEPEFGQVAETARVNRGFPIPSIYLFEWTLPA